MIPNGPLTLEPLARPPELSWQVPGSKSITNRALILAALSSGQTELEGVLTSDDTEHMQRCLSALGVEFSATGPTGLTVRGGFERLRASASDLFVGNSGTTVRFLTALAALVPGKTTLVGDENMARRPILDLVEGLHQLGVVVDCPTGCPPLTVSGGAFEGKRVGMRGDRSSQYFSALLMALAASTDSVEVEVLGSLVSRPYVDVTRAMVKTFGGQIDETATGYVVHPASYRGQRYTIEPDASSASYPFALAAASGGKITVPGLGEEALQGDYAFLKVLEATGANVERCVGSTSVSSKGNLRGLHVDMHDISDTVMTLAAIAPTLSGPTTIVNVANIRIKETDRLLATVTELQRLGQKVEYGADWLTIEPQPIRPATIHCYDDHRIAMSFAILGLVRSGITIADPACVSKTYPTFWDDIARAYRDQSQAVPWQEDAGT